MSDSSLAWESFVQSSIDGWVNFRLGELFSQRKEKGHIDLPLLAITGTGGVVPRESLERRDTSNPDKSKYLLIRKNDIAYNTMRMWQGVSGLSFFDGIASPAYTICVAKSGIAATFAKHLFKFPQIIQVFHRNSQGMVDDTLNLKFENFRQIKVKIPPLPEQKKIASILTAVDDVIESTQAQINKLKDLKTGMMQQLLTEGIGHTEFKDSPVGRIPKAWKVVKLGSVLEKIDSGWSPNCVEIPPNIGEWGVLKVSAVTRDVFLEEQSKTLPIDLEPRESIRVKVNDILLTRANGVAELVGKCVIVKDEPKRKLMMSDKLLRLNPNQKIHRNFLLHIFNSNVIRKQIEFCWGGSSGQKNIGQADIKLFSMPLPSLDEQASIGNSISEIENFIGHKNRKLEQLVLTKKALMQDLLTGKVRVKVNPQ